MTSRISNLTSPLVEPAPGFVACPMVLVQFVCANQPANSLSEIYRIAYERAVELHRPSRWAPLYRVWAN